MLNTIKVTSPYGVRVHPITGKKSFHYGVDLVANYEPLAAYADGTVVRVDTSEVTGYGQYIIIDHGYYRTLYAHLSNVKVFKGQKVKRKQQIAITGNTGNSTGPHLHFEIIVNGKRVDPMMFSEITPVAVAIEGQSIDGVYRHEDQKMYVELRKLSELLGHDVEWTPEQTTIIRNQTNKENIQKIINDLQAFLCTL